LAARLAAAFDLARLLKGPAMIGFLVISFQLTLDLQISNKKRCLYSLIFQ